MTDTLETRLQAALGDAYAIQRELGGGGMSRVFLAAETRLGRQVVIKVLPPEMGAGVSIERFEREIQLAAKLQHPHIVPLLTAGSEGDLLWYVMPYIEGESLRAKLAREGELPIGVTVQILKEVLDALQYAHSHKVVHRDIKPDNVMLSGKHAVVTDFGVAKAVSASTGDSKLTSLGVALGTPAYMSPEQAAADPHVDHRADIYAIGAMAYEMLCGRPPFTGTNAQQVLAAHMTNVPEPVTTHRATVPPALNEVILRCLQKKPADRFQRADDLVPHLDALLTPSGGMTPTSTQPVQAVDHQTLARASHPARVAALFGLAAVGALAIVYALMNALGLPTWVFTGAIGLLALGLPVMLLTGIRQRQRALAAITGVSMATPVGLERHLTWKKAALGGVLAFGGLAVVTAAFMVSRLLGIGPGATLMSSGVLADQSQVLVADFDGTTGDPSLGRTVSELLRIDLGQSRAVELVEVASVAGAVRRMGRDPSDGLDGDLAREVAQREGIAAVVVGEVAQVGDGLAITARLVSSADGVTLVPIRATSKSADGVIDAVDDLSADLRERIGESLKGIRANPPLSQVSTSSFEALEKYTLGLAALGGGDDDLSIALMEEAIALDTSFAMAYRKLGVMLSNRGADRSRSVAAITNAFRHRDRLTERERNMTTATYYSFVEGDVTATRRAYEVMLEDDPNDVWGLIGLGLTYEYLGDSERGLEFHLRAMDVDSADALVYTNVMFGLIAVGRYGEARTVAERARTLFPTDANAPILLAHVDHLSGNTEASAARMDTVDIGGSVYWTRVIDEQAAVYRGAQGKAQQALGTFAELAATASTSIDYLRAEASAARVRATSGEDPARALQQLLATLREQPLDSLDALDRPYVELAAAFVAAGGLTQAKALLTALESEVPAGLRRQDEGFRLTVAGTIALHEGRHDDAIADLKQAGTTPYCFECGLVYLARAYDAAGQPDSALAVFERYVGLNQWWRIFDDMTALAPSYLRMGELYEERGQLGPAVEYYDKFVTLWQDADRNLQPVVADVRVRIARLVGEN